MPPFGAKAGQVCWWHVPLLQNYSLFNQWRDDASQDFNCAVKLYKQCRPGT
jgi:hypothetical protein